jgi:hypothetical protein
MAGASIGAPAAPERRPLERISPSLAEDLRACGLRVAYRMDPHYRGMRRLRPAAALGLVSHDLAEAVARGELDVIDDAELENEIADAWDRHIAKKAEELAAEWPLGAVPPPDRWPGYQLTRVRLLRRLAEEVRRRRDQKTGLAAPQTEIWLKPEGVPLVGRADRVEHRDGEVELVDLKSGWTVDEEIRPAHRRQLLLYAFLWHAIYDEWPRRISIQRLDGQRATLDVDLGDAQRLASEVLAQLAAYNRQASGGDEAEPLASPSAEACAHCDYRLVCLAFFRALSESWGWYRRSLLGEVVGTTEVDALGVLEVALEASNLAPEIEVARVLGVPSSLTPALGARIAVVDATPTPIPQDVRAAWDTRILVWE